MSPTELVYKAEIYFYMRFATIKLKLRKKLPTLRIFQQVGPKVEEINFKRMTQNLSSKQKLTKRK